LTLDSLRDHNALATLSRTHADAPHQAARKRVTSPIGLSWFADGKMCSVRMRSQMLATVPDIVLNLEACTIAILPKAASPGTQTAFHAPNPLTLFTPFLSIEDVEEKRMQDGLELILHGKLDNNVSLPFVLKLTLASDSYRVGITAEMLKLPPGVRLMALCPDVQCEQFGKENHPPFEMAHQSFIFLKNKGFSWISDACRGASEIHQEEGPWTQCFRTDQFAQDRIDVLLRAYKEDFLQLYGRQSRVAKDVAAAPIAGWVARDNAFMIAVAGKNAYEVGTRWVPCLHTNMAAELDTSGAYLPFEARIYALPVDMDMLLKMYKEDFDDRQISGLAVPKQALWPYTPGIPLDSFEGKDLTSWKAVEGTLTAYGSNDLARSRSNEPMTQDTRPRVWMTYEVRQGKRERFVYPEGVTEGKGSGVWEIPSEQGTATLSKSFKLAQEVTHIGVDTISRSEKNVSIEVVVGNNGTILGTGTFLLLPLSNRRLLVSMDNVARHHLDVSLSLKERNGSVKIVLDNLRGFRKT
jgi:hypothetical protein